MESRFIGGLAILGLAIVALGLGFWLVGFPARVRLEYRPPFGMGGRLGFLRFVYYSGKGRSMIARAACTLALQSFIFIAGGWLASKFPSQASARPNAPTLPPDFMFLGVWSVMFSTTLLIACFLLLAAVIQFAWTIRPSSDRTLRINAGYFAAYGIGALLMATAHLALFKLGTQLLK